MLTGKLHDLPEPLAADFQALERGTPPDGGRWGAGLVFLGGLAFLGGCGGLLYDAWRSAVLSLPFAIGPALGAALGAACIYWQWRPLLLLCRTGLPHGAISPTAVDFGDAFAFRYQQKARLPLNASVTVSLVLRESRTMDAGEGTTEQMDRDHLVQAHTERGCSVPAGGLLQIEQVFQLPDEARHIPVSNWPVQGVLKVHVQVRRGADYWEEFLLPASLNQPSSLSLDGMGETGYQVTLVSFPNLYRGLPPPPPLEDYLPHLDHVDRLPLVLLRGLTRAEAEGVCRKLEAAGGVVELGQGGRVIERARVHDLPLPTEPATQVARALPLPASATEATLQSDIPRRSCESAECEQIRRG